MLIANQERQKLIENRFVENLRRGGTVAVQRFERVYGFVGREGAFG